MALADFELHASTRFTNDFRLAVVEGFAPTADESAYVGRVNHFLGRVARYLSSDAQEVAFPSLVTSLQTVYSHHIDNLRQDVLSFVDATSGEERRRLAVDLTNKTYFYEGALADRRQMILRRPFHVAAMREGDAANQSGMIEDIEIRTRDVEIPETLQKFKVDLDRTITVIKVVLGERRSRWRRFVPDFIYPTEDRVAADARQRQSKYLLALENIAKVGLMNIHPSQAAFAGLALNNLKEEFLAREAGLVKNGYLVRLGGWALLLALVGVAGYYATEFLVAAKVAWRFREFFLLAAGAALGTWLSFSLRRPNLRFEELAAIEEDRLNPGIRILFVAALTAVVGLLFWTKAVEIKIGGFSSSFQGNGTFALLIGVLCGIGERSLATVVTRRAEEFTGGIAGRP